MTPQTFTRHPDLCPPPPPPAAAAAAGASCQVAKDRVPGGWSNERIAVAAEHPSLFYELLNAEPALARGLNSKWLKTAVLSSEVAPDFSPVGPRLRFTFTLPPALYDGCKLTRAQQDSARQDAHEINTLMVGGGRG